MSTTAASTGGDMAAFGAVTVTSICTRLRRRRRREREREREREKHIDNQQVTTPCRVTPPLDARGGLISRMNKNPFTSGNVHLVPNIVVVLL
jgi:hypothetical protein